MEVAIVTVGDELLAGETADTNATWLCERLTARGTDVERVTTVPDRVEDIARVVNEYRADYDAVVVTGGLGPTHDDVTTEGVAAALGRDVAVDEAAHEWLVGERGYDAEALAPGTAALPVGAQFVPNEAGVAPGAVVDSVYVLPGVPAEMRATFERVVDDFDGDVTHTETVTTSESEQALVDRLDEFRAEFDAEVGCYPGRVVRLRVRSTDPDAVAAGAAWLRERVEPADESPTDGSGDEATE